MAVAQKVEFQNGTLVSGNMDRNPRNPSHLILSHTQMTPDVKQNGLGTHSGLPRPKSPAARAPRNFRGVPTSSPTPSQPAGSSTHRVRLQDPRKHQSTQGLIRQRNESLLRVEERRAFPYPQHPDPSNPRTSPAVPLNRDPYIIHLNIATCNSNFIKENNMFHMGKQNGDLFRSPAQPGPWRSFPAARRAASPPGRAERARGKCHRARHRTGRR